MPAVRRQMLRRGRELQKGSCAQHSYAGKNEKKSQGPCELAPEIYQAPPVTLEFQRA